MTSREIRIDVGWGKLAAKVWGPDDGRPILALHGWLDNANTFDPLIPLLGDGWRVVALDIGGHGHSDHRPAGMYYSLLDGVVETAAVADSIGWDRFTLLGHSMGGAIASLVAGTLPDRVQAAVFIEALGPLTFDSSEGPERLRAFIDDRRKLAAKKLPVYPDVPAAARLRQQATDITLPAAQLLAERGTRPHEGGVTWRSDPRLCLPSVSRWSEDQVLAYFRAITCPVLLVRADKGLGMNPEIARHRIEAIRDLTIVTVPGGHHAHLDDAESVAPAIREFLARTVRER